MRVLQEFCWKERWLIGGLTSDPGVAQSHGLATFAIWGESHWLKASLIVGKKKGEASYN